MANAAMSLMTAPGSQSPVPSPEEVHLDTVTRVKTLFQQAKDGRQRRVEWWRRAYQMVHNRTWAPTREIWMPSPTASEIYPIVAALVGWMTDQRPMLYLTPAADPGVPVYDMMSSVGRDLEKALEANWNNTQAVTQVEAALWDTLIFGTGFLKSTWNPALEGGLGDAEMVRVDPWRFYPDPQGTSMDTCNYFIEARDMSLQELDRRWPGSSRLVREQSVAGAENIDRKPLLGSNQSRYPLANPAGLNGNAPRYGLPGGGRQSVGDIYDRGVTVYEAWIREHSSEKWTDEDGRERDAVDDHWRVYVVAGNAVIMEAAATEIYGHGRHPYSRLVSQDMGEFWGIALVDHLIPLQLALNRLLAAAQQHAELTGNPVLLEDARSGITRTQVINRPGQRVQKATGSDVKWLDPPPLSPVVMQLIEFYQNQMERVSGLSAIVRGMAPTGRNAQGVLDSVQEAAFVRVRAALRNLEVTLREAGTLNASLIAEFYTQPRILALTGSETMTPLMLRARHFYVPDDSGQSQPLKFSLWIQAGSSVPTSRGARAAEADMLYAMGAIDRKAVLDAHDYPNRQAILERVGAEQAVGMFNPPGARPQVPGPGGAGSPG